MALLFAKQKGKISKTNYRQIIRELELIPEKIEKVLKSEEQIKEVANEFKDVSNFLYLGRGYNFPVASGPCSVSRGTWY